jgi:hypothetical protein
MQKPSKGPNTFKEEKKNWSAPPHIQGGLYSGALKTHVANRSFRVEELGALQSSTADPKPRVLY